MVSTLVQDLQSYGHSSSRILLELSSLIQSECINSESQTYDVALDDLVSISPSGLIHIELLMNVNYLSTISEDTLFRENQIARSIADNLIGRGKFKVDSRQSSISNSKLLMDYMVSYKNNFFVGPAKLLSDVAIETPFNIDTISNYINNIANNDNKYNEMKNLEEDYPPGSQVEAQIVSFQDYGFFVEFGLNGTGLVHKSNYNNINILDGYEVGDWVIVEIIKYNNEHHKFDLILDDA